jgi:parallel beta-helix repeat protein
VVNCTIVRNNISDCYGGIALRDASGCQVYHNNIFSSFWSGGHMLSDPLDSEYHAGGVLDEQGWLNSWDNGYPGGGNYYFDYNGLDLYSGQTQNIPGRDGIGDTPLVIYTYLPGTPAEDHYPLMVPYAG